MWICAQQVCLAPKSHVKPLSLRDSFDNYIRINFYEIDKNGKSENFKTRMILQNKDKNKELIAITEFPQIIINKKYINSNSTEFIFKFSKNLQYLI